MPISSIFLHLFCHVTFSCWLQIFLSQSVAWVWFSTGSSYPSSGGYLNYVGGLLRKISNCVPLFCQQCQFPSLRPFFPLKEWRCGCFLPESVDMQGNFSGISSWLSHVVLLNSVLCQFSRHWQLFIQLRQLPCDCQTSEFDCELYFWNWLFAMPITSLLSKLNFKYQFAKFKTQLIRMNAIYRKRWNYTKSK